MNLLERLKAWSLTFTVLIAILTGGARAEQPNTLYLVPNFHPACMGWLTRYSEERNYCLYTYLAHLDHVAKDSAYKFAFSEIPHLITMMEYEPRQFEVFRQRVKEGRIECVNAFVLEPTVSLSGGEALMQQGVQGLRWYRQVLDVQPRFCWMIDTCGWHEQMAQIVASLGLEAFVYCRYNPTGKDPRRPDQPGTVEGGAAVHWIQSPDGTRSLALNPGHYAESYARAAFEAQTSLLPKQLRQIIDQANAARSRFPTSAPALNLDGTSDYSLPFRYDQYPTELIAAWNKESPDLRLRIATPGEYLDAIMPGLRSGQFTIPTVTSGSAIYGWSSFWVNLPVVKQWYRRVEHSLQAAEALSTIASLKGPMTYPSQQLANAWVLMCLNMDRNTLWGAAVDSPYADSQSWDTWDRFRTVEEQAAETNEAAWRVISRPDREAAALFNPVNWTRRGPFELRLPHGRAPVGIDCQPSENTSEFLVRMSLPAMGIASVTLQQANFPPSAKTDLPDTIETPHYSAKIDSQTGSLVSLKLKPSSREMLGGPANVVLAEGKSDQHDAPQKAQRKLLASSSQSRPFITVTAGKLATIVEARSQFFGGGELRRVMRFYNDSPRIDCTTETNGLPDGTILSIEFPLADDVTEARRGIPFGFSRGDTVDGVPGVTGLTKGILPAVRWSDYAFRNGGGLAILDRGVPGRELVGKTAILLLHNVCETYIRLPVTWMGDQRKQAYSYAILPHAEKWEQADVPRTAWEYNSPVVLAAGYATPEPKSFVQTSDNILVEAIRRDRDQIELRLVECLGTQGEAWVAVHLPHTAAALTDPLGRNPQPLVADAPYRFKVRPQQIVTMRLRTAQSVAPVEALRSFDPLVPPAKREFMRNARNPKLIGHPPRKN